LPAEDEARFTAHLGDCPACSDDIDQQRWIDGLLRSPVVVQLESPPPGLLDSIRGSTELVRRRSGLVACGLAVAAVLLIAISWTVLRGPLASDSNMEPAVAAVDRVVESSTDFAANDSESAEEPRGAIFLGGPGVLVMPVASRHPNVTIVRIYPTFQPAFDTQANIGEFDVDQLNGG
jgi:hypothetical protein